MILRQRDANIVWNSSADGVRKPTGTGLPSAEPKSEEHRLRKAEVGGTMSVPPAGPFIPVPIVKWSWWVNDTSWGSDSFSFAVNQRMRSSKAMNVILGGRRSRWDFAAIEPTRPWGAMHDLLNKVAPIIDNRR